MVMYSAALIPMSLAPVQHSVVGGLYLAGATIVGIGFFATAVNALRRDDRAADRIAFLYSLAYLPILLTVMLVDRHLF